MRIMTVFFAVLSTISIQIAVANADQREENPSVQRGDWLQLAENRFQACQHSPSYDCLIKAALEAASTVKPGQPRGRAHLAIATSHAMTRRAQQALSIARRISKGSLWRDHALGAAAAAFVRTGNSAKAISVMKSISNDRVREVVMGDIAVIHAKAGAIQKARSAISKMPSEAFRNYARIFVAWALVESGRKPKALAFLRKAVESFGPAISVSSLILVARIQSKADRPDLARSTVLHATTLVKAIDDVSQKTRYLAKLATTKAEIGLIDDGMKLAESIDRRDERAKALCAIAVAAITRGNLEKGRKSLTQAMKLPASIQDTHQRAVVLVEVAVVHFHLKDQRTAVNTMATAINLGRKDTESWVTAGLYRRIAQVFVRNGFPGKALEQARRIKDQKVRGKALVDIAVSLAEKGNIKRAAAVAGAISNRFYRAEALASIAAKSD